MYRSLPCKARETGFTVISIAFLLIADWLSGLVLILLALAAAFYGKYSERLRQKKPLFYLTSLMLIAGFVTEFFLWCGYQRSRFGETGLFLRYLPFGTAFFVLLGIRYVIDIMRRKIPGNQEIPEILSYLLFYPRLAMGPLQSMNEHREMVKASTLTLNSIGEGMTVFVKGLGKKVLIADTLGMLFMPEYAMDKSPSLLMSLLTVTAFSLQLYFTVSGYAQMAAGIALCYGFRLPESYGYPVLSGTLRAFDKGWNMTVVSWFKGCFGLLERDRGILPFLGTLFAWTLMGCWMRPELQLVVWGGWMGLWICADRLLRKRFPRIPRLVYGIMFFLAVFPGWTLIMADSLPDGLRRLGLLVGSGGSIIAETDLYFIQSGGLILLVAIYGATSNFKQLTDKVKAIPVLSKLFAVVSVVITVGLFLLCIAVMATNSDINALAVKGVM